MNGNAAGASTTTTMSGGGGTSAGPGTRRPEGRHAAFHPHHQAATFHPQGHFAASSGGNAYAGNAGGYGAAQGYPAQTGGTFVGPTAGYRGYEFVPAQQQGYMGQQQGYGGYAQMSGQGYFYPSGAANAPMPGGMFPGGGAAAAGYATIGAGGMMPPGAGLGMQAGAQGQGSSRYPSFTPMASPSNAANGGVNGSAAQMGPTSPYPAYQHAASASPSLASDSLTTATTTPVPMNGSAGPNSRPNGMSMPSYGMEQNPYAHLHQQHANHPHLNPYANMPYANGNPYQDRKSVV